MPHWRTLIEKDHMGAWDLVDKETDKPRDYTLLIIKVESNVLKTVQTPKGKRKCVITFRGADKKFVANATNCETIEAMYGGDYSGWCGKLITLYPTTTRNPKKSGPPEVPCIRVRPRKPQGQPQDLASRPVDQDMREQQREAFDEAPRREPGEEG